MLGARHLLASGFQLIIEIDRCSFFVDVLPALRNRRMTDMHLRCVKHSAGNLSWRPPVMRPAFFKFLGSVYHY